LASEYNYDMTTSDLRVDDNQVENTLQRFIVMLKANDKYKKFPVIAAFKEHNVVTNMNRLYLLDMFSVNIW